jgi:hypothetical protein
MGIDGTEQFVTTPELDNDEAIDSNIPSFIHISDGKLHDVHALDMLMPGGSTTSSPTPTSKTCSSA